MRFVLLFLLRWIINAFGLWLAVSLFGTGNAADDFVAGSGVFFVAGLILTMINFLLRPIVALVSLPFIILTLGLFMIIINGLMVYFAFQLTPGIDITFGHAILAGIVIGLVNFAMNGVRSMSGAKE